MLIRGSSTQDYEDACYLNGYLQPQVTWEVDCLELSSQSGDEDDLAVFRGGTAFAMVECVRVGDETPECERSFAEGASVGEMTGVAGGTAGVGRGQNRLPPPARTCQGTRFRWVWKNGRRRCIRIRRRREEVEEENDNFYFFG